MSQIRHSYINESAEVIKESPRGLNELAVSVASNG